MSMEALNRRHTAPAVLFVLVFLTTAWAGASAAHGASDRLDLPLDFAIPAEELTRALDRYSQTSGMAILIDRELAQGRRSAPVEGRLGAREALEHLLAGSGLMAVYTGGDAFTVQPAQVLERNDQRPRTQVQRSLGDNFASALQGALRHVLCGSALTRPGQYRAALQLWVGPLGDVQHSRLLASTGDLQRDAAVVVRLRGLRIGQVPPSSLPQPVTVLVVPDSAGSHTQCHPSQGAVTP